MELKQVDQERLEEINQLSRQKYSLSKIRHDAVSQFNIEYQNPEEQVFGTIYVDVNGNIVSSGQSFAENDLEKENYNSNINELGFIQALINFTEYYKEKGVEAIREYDEDIYWACVPQCIRMGACPEAFSPCGFFEKFAEGLTKEELMDMETRYNKYNEFRDRGRARVKSKDSE